MFIRVGYHIEIEFPPRDHPDDLDIHPSRAHDFV